MKIYLNQNVYDAALERIRFIFKEIPVVICSVSGGKDSTVIYNLCMKVARELNRLPLKVMWIDQEAEWQATVDQIKTMMYDPDVDPMWFQMPIRLFNATSIYEHWLNCWDKAQKRIGCTHRLI
jgi:predicted phosphoadenosine phosphosulfate sulfurtransferase